MNIKDILYTILLQTDIQDLPVLCLTNKTINDICHSVSFLNYKFDMLGYQTPLIKNFNNLLKLDYLSRLADRLMHFMMQIDGSRFDSNMNFTTLEMLSTSDIYLYYKINDAIHHRNPKHVLYHKQRNHPAKHEIFDFEFFDLMYKDQQLYAYFGVTTVSDYVEMIVPLTPFEFTQSLINIFLHRHEFILTNFYAMNGYEMHGLSGIERMMDNRSPTDLQWENY